MYAEIVKIGLILSHLGLLGEGKTGGQENIGGQMPLMPPVVLPLFGISSAQGGHLYLKFDIIFVKKKKKWRK